jgi:hypothetical protein
MPMPHLHNYCAFMRRSAYSTGYIYKHTTWDCLVKEPIALRFLSFLAVAAKVLLQSVVGSHLPG